MGSRREKMPTIPHNLMNSFWFRAAGTCGSFSTYFCPALATRGCQVRRFRRGVKSRMS